MEHKAKEIGPEYESAAKQFLKDAGNKWMDFEGNTNPSFGLKPGKEKLSKVIDDIVDWKKRISTFLDSGLASLLPKEDLEKLGRLRNQYIDQLDQARLLLEKTSSRSFEILKARPHKVIALVERFKFEANEGPGINTDNMNQVAKEAGWAEKYSGKKMKALFDGWASKEERSHWKSKVDLSHLETAFLILSEEKHFFPKTYQNITTEASKKITLTLK